jgi:hypothetical protein
VPVAGSPGDPGGAAAGIVESAGGDAAAGGDGAAGGVVGVGVVVSAAVRRRSDRSASGHATPRTLDIEIVVVSFATRMTQTPRPTINSDVKPTMNSVKRSWYLLLIKRFFQLRL